MISDSEYIKICETFHFLSTLKIENPAIRFQQIAKDAKEHIERFGEDVNKLPVHPDPEVEHTLKVSDEEYDSMMNECMRQREFWNHRPEAYWMELFLKTVKPEKSVVTEEENEENLPQFLHRPASDDRREGLSENVGQIRNIRKKLMEYVVGQDHAVHTFTEGLFNAQYIHKGDTDRKGPLATFVFAGPPGTGKTFLSEKAAELLNIPCRRFDMTAYSDHEAHQGLIGFDSTWRNAVPGALTSFVSENPNSVIIFDEIEKAHLSVLHILYQLLDSGYVTDKYMDTYSLRNDKENAAHKFFEPKVSFRDTIIIFTTNAGRSVYEDNKISNYAAIPKKVLLRALETDINPITNAPYFPAALISRFAVGYTIMFNHLPPSDLGEIAGKSLNRVGELLKKTYNIDISADERLPLMLQFAVGGNPDARNISSYAEQFVKKEFFKLCNALDDDINKIRTISFETDESDLPEAVAELFYAKEKPEILIYSDRYFINQCENNLHGHIIRGVRSAAEAVEAASENNIACMLLDISAYNDEHSADEGKTLLTSMSANIWKDGVDVFKKMTDAFPEIPVYLLESSCLKTFAELSDDFIRAGARDVITMPDNNTFAEFEARLDVICSNIFMEKSAAKLALEHKVLCYETAPQTDGDTAHIKIRDFLLKSAPDADDDELLYDSEKPTERFKDVIGAENAKKELQFFVDYLKNPKKFSALGHRFPKGVLLYGSPGTGKTMLAKAVAGECGVTFIPTAASQFVKQYVGTGPAAVRELFAKARKYAPAIIFIDEVDTIGKMRTGSENNRAEEDTLNALLAEMDGFASDPKRPVFVLAATNYGTEEGEGVGVLDEAFMRRFDRKILIDLPNTEERKQLLELHVNKIKQHNISDEIIDSIASRSIGMSPAMLCNVVEAAKRIAYSKGAAVDDECMNEALETVRSGEKKESSPEYITRTAYHESGHAVMYYLSGHIASYLNIEARGNAAGYMQHSDKESDKTVLTKRELLERVRTVLGGRAAEIVIYGNDDGLTTGVSSDLAKATGQLRNMITKYGMDEEFGLSVLWENTPEISSRLVQRINELMSRELKLTVEALIEHRELLEKLAKALLASNRLTENEIRDIVENKQP